VATDQDGLHRQTAISKVFIPNSRSTREFIDQPITCRKNGID
jgi:hypothetical protein